MVAIAMGRHLDALLRVGREHSLDEMLSVGRHEARALIRARHDLLVERRRVGVLKRQVAAQHGEEAHAERPDCRARAGAM